MLVALKRQIKRIKYEFWIDNAELQEIKQILPNNYAYDEEEEFKPESFRMFLSSRLEKKLFLKLVLVNDEVIILSTSENFIKTVEITNLCSQNSKH